MACRLFRKKPKFKAGAYIIESRYIESWQKDTRIVLKVLVAGRFNYRLEIVEQMAPEERFVDIGYEFDQSIKHIDGKYIKKEYSAVELLLKEGELMNKKGKDSEES